MICDGIEGFALLALKYRKKGVVTSAVRSGCNSSCIKDSVEAKSHPQPSTCKFEMQSLAWRIIHGQDRSALPVQTIDKLPTSHWIERELLSMIPGFLQKIPGSPILLSRWFLTVPQYPSKQKYTHVQRRGHRVRIWSALRRSEGRPRQPRRQGTKKSQCAPLRLFSSLSFSFPGHG